MGEWENGRVGEREREYSGHKVQSCSLPFPHSPIPPLPVSVVKILFVRIAISEGVYELNLE